MNTITCVCFDVWNTILQSNPDFKKQRIQIIAEAFSSEPSIIAKIANEIDIEFDKITDLTGRDFNCADRLKLIASKLKKDSYCNGEFLKQLEDNIDQAFLRFLPSLKSDDVIIVLEQLKQKNVTICLLSNTGFISGVYMRKALDLHGVMKFVDHSFFSDEIKVAKPNLEIFAVVTRTVDCMPNNVLHVGDNVLADYEGAIKFGMNALLLNTKEAISNSTTIHSLSELLVKI